MYQDLREFIDEVEKLGELRRIDNADPHLEIGSITEVAASSSSCPMLLFDNIKGYAPGYRIVTNLLHTPRRLALALGLPLDMKGVPLVQAWKDKLTSIGRLAPVEVSKGPITENIVSGKDVDVSALPVPKYHELDGGRYLGTGAMTIVRDPDNGWVNLGVYRLQVHDRSTLGIYALANRHGRLIWQKYWSKKESCPVAVCTGTHPTLFLAAGTPVQAGYGVSEYDVAGWLRGQPVQVIRGELTNLPVPATAEIVLEGEIPPFEVESRLEGPFGEATGYYASGARGEPVIQVKRIMYRNKPILHGAPPMKPLPGLAHWAVQSQAPIIWRELERADIPGIRGVWLHGNQFAVISLKQHFPGQAKQALLVAAGCRAAELSRFIVVVDDDIDPSNIAEVIWAMGTRCEGAEYIDIIRGRPVSGIEPRIKPEDRECNNMTMSQVLIDACRPYHWKDAFPPVNEVSVELKAKVMEKWGHVLANMSVNSNKKQPNNL